MLSNHYYGYFYDSVSSNMTVNLNGSFWYAPLTGQSTGEHETSNANERVPITNIWDGHPVKTMIRCTNNAALNGTKMTCSIHFEPPFNNNADGIADIAPGTVAPGSTSTGHHLFAEVHATGDALNHSAVQFDYRNAYSSSALTDIPSGSRITLSVKSDLDGSVCYIINTAFAWKHSLH
jgi:hypothetical protein